MKMIVMAWMVAAGILTAQTCPALGPEASAKAIAELKSSAKIFEGLAKDSTGPVEISKTLDRLEQAEKELAKTISGFARLLEESKSCKKISDTEQGIVDLASNAKKHFESLELIRQGLVNSLWVMLTGEPLMTNQKVTISMFRDKLKEK